MRRRFFPPAVLLLMATLGSLLLGHPVGAATTITAGITRALEPVILTGTDLPSFLKAPVIDLFVYTYKGGTWSQIPYQVDEAGPNGRVTAAGDGLFDAKDQLVFMAKDLGGQAGAAEPPGGGPWYQIEVTDPLDSAAKGYAYVVRSSTLHQNFSGQYVSFDGANHRITGETYSIGYSLSAPNPGETPMPNLWFDYLALGDTTNILDRAPKFQGCLSGICVREQYLFSLTHGQGGLTLVKEGPVRIILRNSAGALLTNDIRLYGSLTASTLEFFSPDVAPTALSLSTDFNPNANGAKYYNATTPSGGVTIDGIPDTVPATPFSPWWQVTAAHGTVIHASDITPVGGTPSNFYVDNSAPCSTLGCDTGDMMHWGDTGLQVTNPNQSFTYNYNFYFPAGQQPNVGATYAQYFAHPLAAGSQFHSKVFIPLVMKP